MRIPVLLLLLLVVGCRSHPVRVDCDGKLKPINAPAPVATKAATPAPRSTP